MLCGRYCQFDSGRKLFQKKTEHCTVEKHNKQLQQANKETTFLKLNTVSSCKETIFTSSSFKFGVSPMRIIIRDLFSIYDTLFIDINTDVDVQIYLNVQGVHHLVNLAEEPDLLITHCYSPVAFSLSLKPQGLLVLCYH